MQKKIGRKQKIHKKKICRQRKEENVKKMKQELKEKENKRSEKDEIRGGGEEKPSQKGRGIWQKNGKEKGNERGVEKKRRRISKRKEEITEKNETS
jgi:hypothetical protein